MDEINAVVTEITTGIKSKTEARQRVTQFLTNHNTRTNWEFIVAFRCFMRNNIVRRRSINKFNAIKDELFNYLFEMFNSDTNNITEEILTYYECRLINALEEKLNTGMDEDLIFIPYFYPYPETLFLLENAEITTVREFLSCDQTTLGNILKESDELAGELFFLFKMIGLFPETIN